MQSTCRLSRQIVVAALVLLMGGVVAPHASASEAACSTFDWPLERELASLSAPGLGLAESGDAIRANGVAMALNLKPMANVTFALAPERKPKHAGSFGAVVVATPEKPGLHQITLSAEAWVDVVQDGRFLRSVAFSGRSGCAAMRKSVRFELQQRPATIQISGASGQRINLIVTPAN